MIATADMPNCSGVTDVRAGQDTWLVCESTYSGNERPQLDWFRRVHRRHRLFDEALPPTDGRHGHRVNSTDDSDLGDTGIVARQVSQFTIDSLLDDNNNSSQFIGRQLSVLYCPVCDVGVLWPNSWTDLDETWHAGRPRPWPHCVRRGPRPPSPKGAQPPIFDPYMLWPNGSIDQDATW